MLKGINMAITELPASPNGELSHNDVREKINETINVVNPLDSNKPTSRIYISSDADLPNVVGGVSTPDANTELFFNNNCSLTVSITITQFGVSLIGNGVFASGVTYTGTNDFIAVDNQSVSVSNVSILATTSANIFNCTAMVGTIFTLNLDRVRLVTPLKIGTMDGMALIATNFVALNFTDGWSFSGTNLTGFRVDGAFMIDNNNVNAKHFDLASATFQGFDFLGVKMRGLGTFISSDIGGTGNMINNVEGVVYNCAFGTGSGTALGGFTDGFLSNNWNFRDNSPSFATQDSRQAGDIYIDGLSAVSPEVITVTATDTYYEIGTPTTGTWDNKIAERFQINSAGYIQYIGSKVIEVDCILICTVEKIGGGADYIVANIAKNWNAGDTGEPDSPQATDDNTPSQIVCETFLQLNPNDTIRPIFKNFSSTANIQIYSCRMSIKGN